MLWKIKYVVKMLYCKVKDIVLWKMKDAILWKNKDLIMQKIKYVILWKIKDLILVDSLWAGAHQFWWDLADQMSPTLVQEELFFLVNFGQFFRQFWVEKRVYESKSWIPFFSDFKSRIRKNVNKIFHPNFSEFFPSIYKFGIFWKLLAMFFPKPFVSCLRGFFF